MKELFIATFIFFTVGVATGYMLNKPEQIKLDKGEAVEYIAEDGTRTLVKATYDLNQDGVIDIKDLLILQKYLIEEMEEK